MFHVKHKKTGDILSHRSIILPSFYSLYLSTLDPLSGVHLSFLCCGRVDISEGIKPRFSNQSEVCVVRRNIPVDFLSCARFTRNFMSLGPMPMFEHVLSTATAAISVCPSGYGTRDAQALIAPSNS